MEKFKELSFEEQVRINGGGWALLGPVIGLWILADIAMNPNHTIETIIKGFNDGREDGKN